MRISAEERRLISRRLRDRVPASIFSKWWKRRKKQAPQLMLVIAATISFSAEAWAKIEAGEAAPTLQTLQTQNSQPAGVAIDKSGNASIHSTVTAAGPNTNTFTKTYTKEELDQKVPENPVVSLESRVMDEITLLLKRMAANQSRYEQRAASGKLTTSEPTKDAYLFSLAAIKETPLGRKANGDALRTYFNSEFKKVSTDRIKGGVDFLNDFNSGMSFNLNVDEMFVQKNEEQPTRANEIRYGLILEEIVPDRDAPGRAAVGDMSSEMAFAGHADVKWTIGPVTEKSGRKLFNVASYKSGQNKTSGTINSAESSGLSFKSIWNRLRLPKAKFKGSVTPKNFDALATSSANKNKVPAKNDPNAAQWQINAAQAEGYYNLNYNMRTDGQRISAEHEMRVPLINDTAVGRRFDDRFHVIQTSAYNLLIDRRLPSVNAHYMNMEQRYKGDIAYAFGEEKTKRVSFEVRGYATGTVKKEADRKETYSLGYTETL